MREIGLPAALQLTQLEKRMDILAEQNEIAELQSDLRGGSIEETMHTYVLPEEDDADRVLATFDVLFSYLQQKRLLTTVSPIEVGDRVEGDDVDVLPISFTVTAKPEGIAFLVSFIDVSGYLTIGDVLEQSDIDRLLKLTEQENPASVSALEYFLSTELLPYSEEPKAFDEELRKAFSEAAQTTITSVLESPNLRAARTLLHELAPILREQNLWPTRLLTVERVSSETLTNGLVKTELLLHAYVRAD
jgi:hypothetical protein